MLNQIQKKASKHHENKVEYPIAGYANEKLLAGNVSVWRSLNLERLGAGKKREEGAAGSTVLH
jgi:hypothetical protein